jgi:hypothetical protein
MEKNPPGASALRNVYLFAPPPGYRPLGVNDIGFGRSVLKSICRGRPKTCCLECGVPAVYLTSANPVFLAFVALSRMSKLRGISGGPNSDSPRRHHSFAFCFIQLENTFVSRHCRVPFEVAPKAL